VIVSFTLNGRNVSVNVDPLRRVVDLLRDELHLTRTKASCYAGGCGSCGVLLEGNLVPSCLIPAFALRGANVTTFEGFARSREYGEIARAFSEAGYSPCGHCSQGRVLAVHALLERTPDPSEGDILRAFSGFTCQCADYTSLVAAVELAASARKRRRGRMARG